MKVTNKHLEEYSGYVNNIADRLKTGKAKIVPFVVPNKVTRDQAIQVLNDYGLTVTKSYKNFEYITVL